MAQVLTNSARESKEKIGSAAPGRRAGPHRDAARESAPSFPAVVKALEKVLFQLSPKGAQEESVGAAAAASQVLRGVNGRGGRGCPGARASPACSQATPKLVSSGSGDPGPRETSGMSRAGWFQEPAGRPPRTHNRWSHCGPPAPRARTQRAGGAGCCLSTGPGPEHRVEASRGGPESGNGAAPEPGGGVCPHACPLRSHSFVPS